MPFRKRSDGKYVSPSGRVMTAGQVKAYYAKTKGGRKKRKRKRK